MIIEIECYKGDTLLEGRSITFDIFKKQVKDIELNYDRKNDNFISLLCQKYNWTVIKETIKPIYVYDRDIQRLYEVK